MPRRDRVDQAFPAHFELDPLIGRVGRKHELHEFIAERRKHRVVNVAFERRVVRVQRVHDRHEICPVRPKDVFPSRNFRPPGGRVRVGSKRLVRRPTAEIASPNSLATSVASRVGIGSLRTRKATKLAALSFVSGERHFTDARCPRTVVDPSDRFRPPFFASKATIILEPRAQPSVRLHCQIAGLIPRCIRAALPDPGFSPEKAQAAGGPLLRIDGPHGGRDSPQSVHLPPIPHQ